MRTYLILHPITDRCLPTMRIILLMLFTFYFYSTKAQNTFEKVIDTLGNAGALCIQETLDGGYIFCGSSYVGGNHILINKIDSVGTIEWVKPYVGTSSDNAVYIEQTIDSGYIVNGSYGIGPNTKSWLLKLDANGDTLWTKTFSAGVGATQPSENNSMAVYNNAIFGMAGYYKTPLFPISSYAFFISTLNTGNLLATRLYDTTAYGTGASAINKTNTGFIIGGGYGLSTGGGDSYLINANPYGDTIWTKRYDIVNSSNVEFIKAVEQTSDYGFILGGLFFNSSSMDYNIFLVKTDSIGDTLWTKLFWQNFPENIYSLQQTSDGGFIFTGITTDSLSQVNALFLTKTDATGNIEWKKLFGTGSQLVVGAYVKQTKDGGYIVCGLNNNVSNYGTYIIKTDSIGNVLTGLENPEHNNQITFLIYPNPAHDVISVKTKNLTNKNNLIYIYNIMGKCVYKENIHNNELTKIDIYDYAAGIYSVVLKTDKEIVTKIIVLYK